MNLFSETSHASLHNLFIVERNIIDYLIKNKCILFTICLHTHNQTIENKFGYMWILSTLTLKNIVIVSDLSRLGSAKNVHMSQVSHTENKHLTYNKPVK